MVWCHAQHGFCRKPQQWLQSAACLQRVYQTPCPVAIETLRSVSNFFFFCVDKNKFLFVGRDRPSPCSSAHESRPEDQLSRMEFPFHSFSVPFPVLRLQCAVSGGWMIYESSTEKRIGGKQQWANQGTTCCLIRN